MTDKLAGGHFPNNKSITSVTFKENDSYLLAAIKIWALKQKFEFRKLSIYHHDIDNFQTFKHFSDKMGCDINNCDFFDTT